MSGGIIESSNRVWEWSVLPSYDERPERCHRELVLKLLSGPSLDRSEAAQVQQAIVRMLIDAGNRVQKVILGAHS